MGDQGELQLWERTHDLPPLWDGNRVEWSAWETPPPIFMCPPPKPECCGRCGSMTLAVHATGRMWIDLTKIPRIRMGRLRTRAVGGMLLAMRCPDCKHDQILDDAHDLWDLDPSDYGDDGSYEPASPAPTKESQ